MARYLSSEELGDPALEVAGFQLWVHGRQFPESTDYYDGNWLRVTAHAGAPGASVWASGAFLMVPDLLRWADECEALLEGRGKEAKLAPLEPQLAVTILPVDRLGHFMMRIQITPDHLTQEHTFQFEIDQTFLPHIVKRCRAIGGAYPTRGKESPCPSLAPQANEDKS